MRLGAPEESNETSLTPTVAKVIEWRVTERNDSPIRDITKAWNFHKWTILRISDMSCNDSC